MPKNYVDVKCELCGLLRICDITTYNSATRRPASYCRVRFAACATVFISATLALR